MEVAYPLLLKVYGDYKNNVISKADFIAILRLTESYVVRRAVCEIPTSSLNKTFATMRNNIKIDDYLNSIKVAFLSLETYKRFPTDEEFKRKLQIKDIYTMRSINYILVKLENYNNKEPISFTGFTIEHIMPQNDNLKPDWVSALGENWKEDHKTYLHRLGNLTLTKYNSEMGDRPFSEKLLVLKQSATHTLNKYVVEQNIWNIDTIEERTKQLCDYSIDIWKFPAVSQEIISTYLKQSEEPTTKYSIDNYDFSNVFVKMLYTKLDEAIMALNPSIKREFKKLYIAYKYRTNFVDIIIQKTRLRLTINMDFDGLKTAIIEMISGTAVEVDVSSFQNDTISFANRDDVLTYLIHLGYLGYDEDAEAAFVPNEEIRQELTKAIRRNAWDEMIQNQRC